MSIKMKKKHRLSEDVAYGIYDRPITKDGHQDESEESTVPSDLPLQPSEHMSNQLSVQRPPIEDEDFVPGSAEELSRAASAIALLAPSGQIEFFYRSLHKLLDSATDRDGGSGEDGAGDENAAPKAKVVAQQPGDSVSESNLKNAIKKTLLEILTDDEKSELDTFRGRSYDTGGIDYFGDAPADSTPARPAEDTSGDTMSLDDIAAEMGYSGASGIRQEIQRITDKLKYFVTKVKRDDLNTLIDFAAGEYVDTMLAADLIEEEDAQVMRSNLGHIKSLDSFRFFFVGSFVMPSYREVVRNSTRSLNAEIEQLGIPKGLHQTVFNQVTGASKRGTIAKKLASMVKAGKIQKEQAIELVQTIEPTLPALVAAADKSDDLVEKALDKWQSTSKKKRIAAIEQAVSKTGENS